MTFNSQRSFTDRTTQLLKGLLLVSQAYPFLKVSIACGFCILCKIQLLCKYIYGQSYSIGVCSLSGNNMRKLRLRNEDLDLRAGKEAVDWIGETLDNQSIGPIVSLKIQAF